MKRASTAEKKEERRASIVAGARRYIATRSFEEVRLGDLAHELGVVKGTLYLYFPTKQDLFASILVEEMEAWWAELLEKAPGERPGADMSAALSERGLLVRLIASLHMTIEPGLTQDGLKKLKTWFAGFAARASGHLEARYPGLPGRGFALLMGAYAIAVGAAQLAFPPENVRKVLESEQAFAAFRIEFETFFGESVDALYRGLRAG